MSQQQLSCQHQASPAALVESASEGGCRPPGQPFTSGFRSFCTASAMDPAAKDPAAKDPAAKDPAAMHPAALLRLGQALELAALWLDEGRRKAVCDLTMAEFNTR